MELRWHQDRVMANLNATMLRRGQRAAAAVEKQVHDRLGTPYPPASRPGEPPARRTGALQRSIKGTVSSIARRLRVTVSVAAPYASFLVSRGRVIMTTADARLIVDILSGRR